MNKEPSDEAVAAFDNGEFDRAMFLFLPLADDGDARAQCYVATMFQGGLGVEADGMKALSWYLKAAEQNKMDGQISGLAYHNVATIYAVGMPGVEQNKELAQRYLHEAALLGVDLAPRR